MSPTTSALVVAIVGVAGTLLSGVLAHRGALRAKSLELRHSQLERKEERLAVARREDAEGRRQTYAQLNQALRNTHAVLWRHREALASGHPAPDDERADARRQLNEVYAAAQMVVTDDVLLATGTVFHQLQRISTLLDEHAHGTPGADSPTESLDQIRERLSQASEGLYEVRQHMRKDLGITSLPITRPDDHGAR